MMLSKTNLVLAFLLLFSVCLNFGLVQSFLNRPSAGEKTLQVSHYGEQLTLTIGDGQSYPISVLMNSDQARALARSVSEQADELDGNETAETTVKAADDGLQQRDSDKDSRLRKAEIQERMKKGSTDNPFENY